MSESSTPSDENACTDITTEEDFWNAIERVVREADSNGVDVRGDWPVTGNGDAGAWDVEIAEVPRRSTVEVEDTEFPATVIVEAVAEREGSDRADLPPVYDAVGPDILEVLHESDGDDAHRVTFGYCGYTVTVTSDDAVILDG